MVIIVKEDISKKSGQHCVLFGDAVVEALDCSVGCETCEELFTPDSPNINLALNGVEIVGNGSGSHHELRKLKYRVDLMATMTKKNGGIYLYANQRGCDGGRLYYDGTAMIVCNGAVIAMGEEFGFRDVEVITATLDVDSVRAYRGSINSHGAQANSAPRVPRVQLRVALAVAPTTDSCLTRPLRNREYVPCEEEIARGPACWLWDYLRRSKLSGFFLPLSGGADSSAVAAIVGCMCQMLFEVIDGHEEAYAAHVLEDLRTVVGTVDGVDDWKPKDAREIASKVFYTCYMGTKHSSDATRQRAADLAEEIGASHLDANIDDIVAQFGGTYVRGDIRGTGVFTEMKIPQFKSQGGSSVENLALQNIQARTRMTFGYMLSQLLPWSLGRRSGLLVLASANVDEALRGYLTKYDCSSGDLNPIGAVSKRDLAAFLDWAVDALGYKTLRLVRQAPPTAELEPRSDTYEQVDEVDMGMTYGELSEFGRLRIEQRCGPLSMFERLMCSCSDEPVSFSADTTTNSGAAGGLSQLNTLEPRELAKRVKRFFFYYGINRHKATVLTPSYHAESYSPDDNRYDLRPFLYNSKWQWQFDAIDRCVERLEANKNKQQPLAQAEVAGAAAAPFANDVDRVTRIQAALRAAGVKLKEG
eukprot:CAMPEP_0168602046 /NCGR_PEP_ID=MMETSP0420-20121227/13806_1 /TAXON_ID=498008 /ORGANISM="Pessonella sp." /LENGTH=643 /DNA_ID=CAMNT_0008640573 /DNA_START=344 /DNA_END=2272 /DNA_ORIENTATION=+